MSTIIESYYKEANIMPLLIKQKLDNFIETKILRQNLNIGLLTKSI